MYKLFAFATLLLALLLLCPDSSVSQQPKKNKDNPKNNKNNKDKVTKEETTPQDYASLAQVKEIVGKVADVNLTSGVLTLTVEYQHYEPNPNPNANNKANQQALKLQQQLQNDYNRIMNTKNAAQRQQALAQYQLHLQQLQAQGAINLQNQFIVVTSRKDVELNTAEKLKVARSKLEAKYNDEGELVRYTADELKKMKSAEITGAYTATPEDIRVGQVAKLYLAPPKNPKKAATDAKKADTKKTDTDAKKADMSFGEVLAKQAQTLDNKAAPAKDANNEPSMRTDLSDRPQIRMVLIMDTPGVPELTDPLKR